MPEKYDCQMCGACCYSPWTGDAYVRLYEIDIERLRPHNLPVIMQTQGYGDPPEVLEKLGTKMDSQNRRVCIAFVGSVAEPCGCGVYEDRPVACRKFEVGDVLCREARVRMGLPL
jgi:Fe-S-cluster containining protein